MSDINLVDVRTSGFKEYGGAYETYLTSAAVTKGYVVAIASTGTVAHAATATLHQVIGVATQDAASGEEVQVQVRGFNDFVVTDGNVAATDLVLCAVNGGTTVGHTEAEIEADPTLAYHVIGRNLGADVSTAGICYVGPTVG